MLTARQFRTLQAAHAARITAMLNVDREAFTAAHQGVNKLEAIAYRRASGRQQYIETARQLEQAARHPLSGTPE